MVSVSEIASREKIRVESHDLVTSGTKHRSGNRANVSLVTRQKNSHSVFPCDINSESRRLRLVA